jgi:hypothetical protein
MSTPIDSNERFLEYRGTVGRSGDIWDTMPAQKQEPSNRAQWGACHAHPRARLKTQGASQHLRCSYRVCQEVHIQPAYAINL